MGSVARESVFETNSSSTHSICISNKKDILDMLPVDDKGVCSIHPGEFGWEIADYSDAPTKASYCLAFAKTEDPEDGSSIGCEDMLREVVMEATGAKEVVFVKHAGDGYTQFGYIDHQSHRVAANIFESKKTLRDFIFNPNSTLHTDNDNH